MKPWGKERHKVSVIVYITAAGTTRASKFGMADAKKARELARTAMGMHEREPEAFLRPNSVVNITFKLGYNRSYLR